MNSISKSKLICVEGMDEVNFFNALFTYLKIDDVQIFNFEGKTNFKAKLKAISLMRNFDKVIKIALIRDADNNPTESAFQSLKLTIESSSLEAPEKNQCFSEGKPSLGVFIFPREGENGALEDLCLDSLNKDETTCIEHFFNCRKVSPSHFSKAKILCHLSSKDPYSNSLGIAALKGHWDFSNESFVDIIQFIEKFKS